MITTTQTLTLQSAPIERYLKAATELEDIIETFQTESDPLSQKIFNWSLQTLENEVPANESTRQRYLTDRVHSLFELLKSSLDQAPLTDPILYNHLTMERWQYEDYVATLEEQNIPIHEEGKPHSLAKKMIEWVRSLPLNNEGVISTEQYKHPSYLKKEVMQKTASTFKYAIYNHLMNTATSIDDLSTPVKIPEKILNLAKMQAEAEAQKIRKEIEQHSENTKAQLREIQLQ